MEAEIAAGRYFGRQSGQEKTFAEFIDRYIERELPKNPKGYAKQKMLLTWWKSQLGPYYLCHVTPGMIGELRDKLMSETIKKGTLRTSSTTNRYLAALSRALTISQREWHWIKENPALQITRPKENKGRERYFEKDEITKLLELCRKSKSPHLYPVTLFAVNTGARRGEILDLKWDDIDFERCTVTFRNTKNGDDRTIHLTQKILNCLLEERNKRTMISQYVFPSADGKKPGCIRGSWERAIAALGLKGIVCFHSIRHSVASHLAMAGYTMLEIGKILGHRSVVTMRYAHLSTAATVKALNHLNDEIFGTYMHA